jgi:hypothetical protein
MPKIAYRQKKFSADRRDKISKANVIIDEYRAKGYELTLRQLYYQFVSRAFIENNVREYKNLGEAINDGRLCGLIDWNSIVDLTRNLEALPHWDSPADIIADSASQYRIDKWADQIHRIEVWIEKDAVSNIVGPACQKLQVPLFSCRGYTSQSEMWKAAQRLARHKRLGQIPYIIHLGDHDPSGKDMTRDIIDQLAEFSRGEIEVNRVALNMEQIEQYSPPPNPAKLTDSRATAYIAEFGDESWELDALTPEVMAELITDTVEDLVSSTAWDDAQEKEDEQKLQLEKVSENWDKIVSKL